MVNAGFNPLEEIARKTGKSIGELKEEMSKGAISSKMVQDAFISATSAGGKFFGMSQEGAKTLNGQISMLQESFDMMFNEIGQKGEGVIMGTVKAGTYLVEHYEQVGKILEGVVVAYGSYKAALLVNIALEKVQAVSRLAHARNIGILSAATGVLKGKVQALNITMLKNPYALVFAALVTIGYEMYRLSKQSDTASAAQKRLKDANNEVEKSTQMEISKLNGLRAELEQSKKGTDKWKSAKDAIISQYGQYDSKLAAEIDRTGTLTSSYNNLTTAIRKSVAARQLKQFYDSNMQETQDDIQSRRNEIYKGLKKQYSQQTSNLLMKYVNQYVSTGKGLDQKITYKGKPTTVRNMINNVHGSLFGFGGGSNAREARELQVNSDKAVKDFVAMNNISQAEANEILYGIKPTEKEKTSTTKNRKYWEDKKKEAQSKLDALSYIEAKGKKGQALKKKIASYDKYLSAYPVSTNAGGHSGGRGHSGVASEIQEKRIVTPWGQSDEVAELATKGIQSHIDAMQNGYEKEKEQRELNHKKELADLDKYKHDYLNKKRDNAKEKFEADTKNKGKKFNAASVKLTQDEQDKFDKMRSNILEKHANEDKEAEDEMIRNNQSYYDRKINLVKKYSKDVKAIHEAISSAEKRGDKERVDALQRSLTEARVSFGKEQMSLAFEQLKKDPDYVVAFDDLKGASTDTLNSLIGRFQDVKQAAGESLDPEGIKTYFDTINSMLDELINRDPIGMIKKLNEELIKQQDAFTEAKRRRDRIKSGEKVIKSVDYNKDLKKLVVTYWELSDAEADVAAKGQQVNQTTNKINKAHRTLSQTVGDLANKMSELGNEIGGQTSDIFSMFGSIMSYYQTISDGVTAVGRAGSGAMKTIESASVILTIISAAIQLMQTLNSILPNQDTLYEKTAKKQAEINKMRDSVDDYRLAVMKARHEESNWFSDSGLKGLQDAYEEHGQVAEEYYKKLNEAQEQYVNKSSGLKKALVPIVAGVTAIAAVAAGVFTAGTGTVAIGALGASIIGALTTAAVTTTVSTAVGAAVVGLAGAIVGKAIDSAVSSISYKNGQVAAKDNLRIQTRHKSFWRSQKTADLRKWVKDKYGKDLFGEDGLIDKELANEVLKNYGNKLQGETKETLEKLVELREKYDEFNKSIHEYVSKMYSPLVSDMTDAVWSWLKDGKDALSEFKNSASKTFADISKDMVKQLLLKNVFSKYEDKLSDLYKAYAMKGINEKELGAASAELAGQMVDSMNTYLPVAQNLMKYLQEGFAAKGIDITKGGDSSQTASANGVTSITYEQASDIVALTTAGNISRDQIKDILLSQKLSSIDLSLTGISLIGKDTVSIADETRTILANSYMELKEINKNTGVSAKCLTQIDENINSMNRLIKDKL